jgi:hypothetical protein
MEEQVSVVTRNVSIYPEQDAAVQELSDRYGLSNYSAALRIIISEWKRMTAKAGREQEQPA